MLHFYSIYFSACENVSACVCFCVCVRAQCSEEPLLAAASPRCSLPAPLSILWASCHHTEEIRTEQYRCDSPPFSVQEPCGKGRPSAAELMKALLNSQSTKPCMSAVQSPVPSSCVSASKPSGELGMNHEGMLYLPNHSTLCRADEHNLSLQGLWVKFAVFFFPRCFSALHLIPYIASQVWFIKPVHFIISSFSL